MNIYSATQIKSADAYTIAHEAISSINLMERAAEAFVQKLLEILPMQNDFCIFCGSGNNGGDGFAVARMLHSLQKNVCVLWVKQSNITNDCRINYERLNARLLETSAAASIIEIHEAEQIPEIPAQTCIIDALFGSGLNRAIEGSLAHIIAQINSSNALKIAIDIPSGLFCDKATPAGNAVVEVQHTITFQYPKLQFLFAENSHRVGAWHCVNIGLHPNFEKHNEAQATFVTTDNIALHTRNEFSHKGTFGYALLAAGSFGKMGAAVLSARACISSGCGLITTHIPRHGNTIMQISVPEAMTLCDENEEIISIRHNLFPYSALGIGPGIATSEKTDAVIEAILRSQKPTVLDADALNIIARNRNLLSLLHQNCIITPHPGEFDRLTQKHNSCFERFETQQKFAVENNCTVILKGRYTCICTPCGEIFFNSSGNSGMATAGSGDVLTGIILSLLAQNYTITQSAVYGVFIHGLAGDFAKQTLGEESITAQKIVEYLPKAFLFLHKKPNT